MDQGVKYDCKEAVKLWQFGAEQGHENALKAGTIPLKMDLRA